MSVEARREAELKRLKALLGLLLNTAETNPASTYAAFCADEFRKASNSYRARPDICSWCGLHEGHNPGCPNEDA